VPSCVPYSISGVDVRYRNGKPREKSNEELRQAFFCANRKRAADENLIPEVVTTSQDRISPVYFIMLMATKDIRSNERDLIPVQYRRNLLLYFASAAIFNGGRAWEEP